MVYRVPVYNPNGTHVRKDSGEHRRVGWSGTQQAFHLLQEILASKAWTSADGDGCPPWGASPV